MCTAITFKTKDHYFGRNLDLEYRCQETVTVTPRNFPFQFKNGDQQPHHFAMIGMATVADGYPLYYDATNEKGLSMAALNFPGYAVYYEKDPQKTNLAPFELIPWVLGKYATVNEARIALSQVSIQNLSFSKAFPVTALHWIIDDGKESIILESTSDGVKIWDDPVGVLTNSPPFEYHLTRLREYLNLTPTQPSNRFSHKLSLTPISLGMGSIGLPGDPSSVSRFIKASFVKLNSLCGDGESESISQFFHILASVAQPRGVTQVRQEEYEITQYTSCCNATKGIYYYTTYENSCVRAVDMHRCDLDGRQLITYPLDNSQNILYQN